MLLNVLNAGKKKHLLQFTTVDEEVLCFECSKRMPNNKEEESDEDETNYLSFSDINTYRCRRGDARLVFG